LLHLPKVRRAEKGTEEGFLEGGGRGENRGEAFNLVIKGWTHPRSGPDFFLYGAGPLPPPS